MLDAHQIRSYLKGKTVITHTGHRNIPQTDHNIIHEKLLEKLGTIIQGGDRPFCLVTGIEKGADELVIEAALQLGVPLYVLCTSKTDADKATDLIKSNKQNSISVFHLQTNPNEPADETYKQLANLLIAHTDIMIVLWDGVFNGKKGGTSDIVDCLINNERKKKIVLLQLVVPRDNNFFPLGRYFQQNNNLPSAGIYAWVESELEKNKHGLLNKVQQFLRKNFRSASPIIFRFIVPFALTLSVIFFGMFGYKCYGDKEKFPEPISWNGFFFSVNLITLNSSVFDYTSTPKLTTARLLGGATAAYAFILAFYFALGYENRKRLYFYFHRLFKGSYNVVIGLNKVAFETALNSRKNKVTIVLYNEDENKLTERCKAEGIWLIKGNPYAAAALRKTYFENAETVYVITDNEENNFRCIQEMDELVAKKEVHKNEAKWFVQLRNINHRSLLQDMVRSSNRTALTSFSIEENTARRLLAKYPLNRYTNPSFQNQVCIVIISFTEIAKQIILSALEQSVLLPKMLIKINIYYSKDEEDSLNSFISKFDFLKNINHEDAYQEVIEWTLQKNNNILNTYCLTSDDEVDITKQINPRSFIQPDTIISVYLCRNSGIANASLLSSLLPEISYTLINNLKCDVSVFWHYNFPDKDEEAYLQKKLNTFAPHLPVISFGNNSLQTTETAIANDTMDYLARQIALWYYLLYDYKSLDIERNSPETDAIMFKHFKDHNTFNEAVKITNQKKFWIEAIEGGNSATDLHNAMNECWKRLKETDREGNRQSADHIWIKLNEAGIRWQLDHKKVTSDDLYNFWREDTKNMLATLEQRRWNMMKLLEGYKPFTGDNNEWNKHKELLKNLRLHQLLMTQEKLLELHEFQAQKDIYLIEGIPFYLNFYFKQKLNKYLKNIN